MAIRELISGHDSAVSMSQVGPHRADSDRFARILHPNECRALVASRRSSWILASPAGGMIASIRKIQVLKTESLRSTDDITRTPKQKRRLAPFCLVRSCLV